MKIALVHDSSSILIALESLLKKDPAYKIIWKADNALDAIQECRSNLPDLILMDVDLKDKKGAEATKEIMRDTPTAILIIAGSGQKSDNVFYALGEGALDAVTITHEGGDILEEKQLLQKIQTIRRLQGKVPFSKKYPGLTTEAPAMGNGEPFPIILAIGASTGGPVALSKILKQIPHALPLATVIVQHVDEKFISGLAHWLSDQTGREVRAVIPGEFPSPGAVMLASRNQHLIVRHNGALHYTSIPKDSSYTPSVDVFFHSLSQHWPILSIAVLLTGMGNDGARGLKSLKDKGWHTIAEHEKSCVIYGMPRAAIEAGAAEEVIECTHMPAAILAAYRSLVRR